MQTACSRDSQIVQPGQAFSWSLCCLLGCMAGLAPMAQRRQSQFLHDRHGTAQVLARPHYLLATLLLCNAAAMEALPIFLDRLLNPLAAILISGRQGLGRQQACSGSLPWPAG